MPLNSNDKLKLLSDILQNQQATAGATEAECLQINRLIQSLTDQNALDSYFKNTLHDIYTFTEQAQQQVMNEHISQNHQNLQGWIQEIDSRIE